MGAAPVSLYFALGRTSVPQIRGIAHVELSVTDLDVSAAWYAALLDARETLRAATERYDIVACALRHLAFAVADEAELEAWRDRLDVLGIAHGEIDDYGYGLAIALRDPDGIALEFICPPRKAPIIG
jgi:glyoxylase I family protein